MVLEDEGHEAGVLFLSLEGEDVVVVGQLENAQFKDGPVELIVVEVHGRQT